jgi:hypothetical protein
MKIQRLFFIVSALILLTVAGIVISHSDARTLPVGTVITVPGGTQETLTSPGFLLNRDDMNAATIALQEKAVNAKEIFDLRALSDKQQKKIENETTWKIVIGVASFALGVVGDEMVHR